jgi:PD-(D/E)XK endonuclease
MNTKRKGNISEAKVLSSLVSKGWVVLQPFGDTEPYDLVIDRGLEFERVQVKTGRTYSRDANCIEFNAYSISGRTRNQTQTKYTGLIDLFAVYYPVTDDVFLIPIDEITSSKPLLRLVDTCNNQSKKVKYARDYILAR